MSWDDGYFNPENEEDVVYTEPPKKKLSLKDRLKQLAIDTFGLIDNDVYKNHVSLLEARIDGYQRAIIAIADNNGSIVTVGDYQRYDQLTVKGPLFVLGNATSMLSTYIEGSVYQA